MSSIELRVHGVAGTSPESMLDLGATLLEPVPNACGEPPADERPVQVGIYGRPEFDPPHTQVEAFRWGGLTSGRPSTARWLLLVPFVLLNAAGWATVPDGTTPALAEDGPSRSMSMRIHIALVRVGGLLLTGIAAGVMALVMDIGLLQWAFARFEWLEDPTTRRVMRGIGFSVVALLMVGLWHWTRLQLRPDATKDERSPASDPAGYGRLHVNQAAMWNHPGIITRLRNLHLGFSLGVVGWIAAVAPTYQTGQPTSVLEAGLAAAVAASAIVFPVLAIGILSIRSGAKGEDAPISWWGRWPALILGLAAALVGIWRTYRWEHAGENLPVPALRGSVIAMSALLAVVVVMTWLNQEVVRRRAPVGIRTPFRTTFTAPALMFLSLAGMVGAGASLALILVHAAGGDDCKTDPTFEGCPLVVGEHLDWVAIAYTAALLIAIVAATIAMLTADGSPLERIKRVVTKPARVFGWTFLIGVVATTALIAAVAVSSLLTGPDALQEWLNANRDKAADIVGIVVGVVVAVAVVGIGGLKWGLPGIGAGAAAIVVMIWAAITGKQIIVLGVPLPPTSGIQAVMAVGLLLPIGAVITRLFAGMRSVEARRGLGVIWDLGMFWPRWFHPFTPPTYSDRAVTELAARIGGYSDPLDPTANQYDCVLVSAHSQGSVLATSALLLISQKPGDSHLERVGLLTHGSPWGRLYGELFPSVFNAEALTNLTTVLGGPNPGDGQQIRWRNLQRRTDPIGGPIVTAEQPWLMPDPTAFSAEVERDAKTGAPAVAGSADPRNRIHSGYTLEPGHDIVASQLWSLTCGTSEAGHGPNPKTSDEISSASPPASRARKEHGGEDGESLGNFEPHRVQTPEIAHIVHLGPMRGPGVLLLHELAGLTPNTMHLAREISNAGFTVAVPHLFGRMAGEGIGSLVAGATGLLGRCINREMSSLVFNQPVPGTRWLNEAVMWLGARAASPKGVGVIGMCATGCYALGSIFDPGVGAVVASQTATPALRPGGWGVRGGDQNLKTSSTPLMALRFRRDLLSAKRRVNRLPDILAEELDRQRTGPDDPTLPACARGIEVQSGDRLRVVWADGSGHSVLNEHRVDHAVAEMIRFLRANLHQ